MNKVVKVFRSVYFFVKQFAGLEGSVLHGKASEVIKSRKVGDDAMAIIFIKSTLEGRAQTSVHAEGLDSHYERIVRVGVIKDLYVNKKLDFL